MENAINEVSKIDMLMSEFQNQGKSEWRGLVKTISVRIPVGDFSSIDAFSRHTGMSKNKVIVQLLNVALDGVVAGLDRKNRKALDQLQIEVMKELEAEGYGEDVGDL